MANKKICDRCGREIKESDFCLNAIARNLTMHFYLRQVGPCVDNELDLCDECEKELRAWLNKDNHGFSCSDCAKEVVLLNSQIKQLEKENEMLKNSTVKELLESMDIEVSVSIKKKDED